jgi:hypothetical protein
LRKEIDRATARVQSLEKEIPSQKLTFLITRDRWRSPEESLSVFMSRRAKDREEQLAKEKKKLEAELVEARKTLMSLQSYATFWGINYTRQGA